MRNWEEALGDASPLAGKPHDTSEPGRDEVLCCVESSRAYHTWRALSHRTHRESHAVKTRVPPHSEADDGIAILSGHWFDRLYIFEKLGDLLDRLCGTRPVGPLCG